MTVEHLILALFATGGALALIGMITTSATLLVLGVVLVAAAFVAGPVSDRVERRRTGRPPRREESDGDD